MVRNELLRQGVTPNHLPLKWYPESLKQNANQQADTAHRTNTLEEQSFVSHLAFQDPSSHLITAITPSYLFFFIAGLKQNTLIVHRED
jgi:hypothetical protein